MNRRRIASLDTVVAGGVDREGGGDGPVVVLLHGFGAPGDDLVPLWRALDVPSTIRFVFPAAPLEVPMSMGGRAWWPIDMERLERELASGDPRSLTRETPEGLAPARAAVTDMLTAIEGSLNVTREGIILGGFSQGAMLACDVALRSEAPVAGLILMSGVVVGGDDWAGLAPAHTEMPVLQSHGRQDPMLPFEGGEMLRDVLTNGGLTVEWMPFHGGHEIPQAVLDGVGAFVTRIVSKRHSQSDRA